MGNRRGLGIILMSCNRIITFETKKLKLGNNCTIFNREMAQSALAILGPVRAMLHTGSQFLASGPSSWAGLPPGCRSALV